jgi:methyl-accepting chemotaxis protein
MQNWSPSWRAMFVLQLVDAPFIPVVVFGWAALLSVELHAVLIPGLIISVVRALVTMVYLRGLLRPVDEWQASARGDDETRLLAANEALARTPIRIAYFYGGGWALSYVVATAWVWFALAARAPIGVGEVWSASFLIVASFFGSVTLAFAIVSVVITEDRAEVSRAFSERGIAAPVRPLSLAKQLVFFLHCFVITSAALIGATGWSNNVVFDRYQSTSDLGSALTHDITRVAAGFAPNDAKIVEAGALPPLGETAAIDPLPKLDYRFTIDRRGGRASAAQELPDGRWLLVEGSIEKNDDLYGTKLTLFTLVILFWAPATIVLTVRSLIDPLRDLEAAMRRLIEVGDIRGAEHLPVCRGDEIGTLTRCFNELVGEFRALAEVAHVVAQGDLSVEIEQRGELHDAFRVMVDHLHGMVMRIRETAVDVETMSARIHAAAQAQEGAAAKSSRSMSEASDRVDTLAAAAEHITTVADGVLDNARQALTTADAMVERINQLTIEATGIGDLLDVIREIADRSDLLALNGSLEATRAGESGRGFALVATEMRRLAERVTATVADVRERVADIKSSGSSTVVATQESRKLANATATAAREISVVTRRQRDETEHASGAMHTMAEFVTEASMMSSQTRAAAESLRQRVEELNRHTRRFTTRETSPRGL